MLASRYFTKTLSELVCPVCGANSIVYGEDKCYETLTEHVMFPNSEDYSLRKTLICSRKECPTYGKGFWSEGEMDWYGRESIPSIFRGRGRHIKKDAVRYSDDGIWLGDTWRYHLIVWIENHRFYWGNLSVRLRRGRYPSCEEHDHSLRGRFLFSLGVFIMDPLGKGIDYHIQYRKDDAHIVHQWTRHPLPWVRRKARKYVDEYLSNNPSKPWWGNLKA